MEKILLEDCCEILDSKRIPITAADRQEGEYPYYGANGIQDYVSDYIFDDELVLLAEDGGNFGSKERPIAYRVSGKCWINNHAHVLKPKKDLNVDYLCYALMFYKVEGMVNGATRQKLTQAAMRKMQIPLRSMAEQIHIVKELNHVTKIKEKRQQEIGLLDDLIKARFVEMFGDPLVGTAKYSIHQVGAVANLVDPQPSHRTPPIEEDGIPYVSIKDCDYKNGKIDFEGARKVSRKVLEEHLNRYTLHDGDFVIGKIGTIGNPVFVPARDDYTLSANVVLVQPNRELVNPYFLKYSFESDFVERQFAEAKNSTSQSAFGIQKVRTVEVMNPDLNVQRGFAAFVNQVNKSKVVKGFDSLSQQNETILLYISNLRHTVPCIEQLTLSFFNTYNKNEIFT